MLPRWGRTAHLNCRIKNLAKNSVLDTSQRFAFVNMPSLHHATRRLYNGLFGGKPITTIPGGPELYIDVGSTVNLTCIVKHLPDPPTSVHWTHNNEEINYDSPRRWCFGHNGKRRYNNLLLINTTCNDSRFWHVHLSALECKSQIRYRTHTTGEHPAAVQGTKKITSYASIYP
ncbi:hypothetical protein CVS40_8478 [Lucilia cuprina]|nr:hypothetical protein CVS40_8478 [Lucilia cuprina]